VKKACAVNQPDLLGCFNTILRQSQGHTSSHGGICVPPTRAFQFAIRIDSSCESIRFVKNRPFASLVVMQFFLLIYCIVSAKNTPQCTQLKAIVSRTSTKNSYAMHTIKITANLLFEYQCTSGKFISFANRIEKNRFGCENRIESFFARIGMLCRQPPSTCRTAFQAQHLWPLGVLSCWPDGLKLSLSRILSRIQRAAPTVFGVYLKHTCSRDTSQGL